jgi:hypothetical protein
MIGITFCLLWKNAIHKGHLFGQRDGFLVTEFSRPLYFCKTIQNRKNKRKVFLKLFISGGPKKATKSHAKRFCIRRKAIRAGGVENVLLDHPESLDLPGAWISESITAVSAKYFKECGTIRSVVFESNSRLIQIELSAFCTSSIESIEIPLTVEILGFSCFYECKSLSPISFESNSRLNRIESSTFSHSPLASIEIP